MNGDTLMIQFVVDVTSGLYGGTTTEEPMGAFDVVEEGMARLSTCCHVVGLRHWRALPKIHLILRREEESLQVRRRDRTGKNFTSDQPLVRGENFLATEKPGVKKKIPLVTPSNDAKRIPSEAFAL